MLKKIFNIYSETTKKSNLMNFAKFLKLSKDLKIFNINENFDQKNLEIIFTKRSNSKYANYKNFIEILFQLAKLAPIKLRIGKNMPKKIFLFKNFYDVYLQKMIKEIHSKIYSF